MTKKEQLRSARTSSNRWAKVASAVSIALALPAANAVDIDWGKWSGSFDSRITVGSNWRMEDIDPRLIGIGKVGDGVIGTAASHNGDDGNLNFHKGDAFSTVINGSHELGLEHESGFGFFVRGFWSYDDKLENGTFRYYGTGDPSTYDAARFPNNPFVNGFSDNALRRSGTDSRLLDAFIYDTFYIGDNALQVRLGEQVINWGESTFIQHSISEANPLDVTLIRQPGAELRNAFIPVQTLWASYDINESLSVEAYVQFEWERIVIDEPGTYFATTDFVGRGGDTIWLGFGATPEYTPNTGAFRIQGGDQFARDDGQFGLKAAYYDDESETEYGFYYLNYHNKRPIINTFAHDGVAIRGFLEYLEDIQLYGFSFNTQTDGGLSIAGELSYRVDEPLQVDDVELLFAALQSLDGALIPDGTSQLLVEPALGEQIDGYRLFDNIQGQVTLTNLFGPTWGADQLVGLVEIGFNQIQNLPDQDVLRFEVAGTRRSGNPDRAAFEGVSEGNFATEFSWGFRSVLRAEYLSALGGWNVSPRLVYQRDVSGYTPAPISNFIEGRETYAVGVTFDYLQQWRIDVAYNIFAGGGTQNLFRDRDFVGLNASYAF